MKHGPALVVLAALTLLVCTVPCSATTVYVKWDSPGPTFDGTSWTTAFHTIQAGLTAAVSGDEVWVARGTYSGQLTLKAGAGLYGGFAGTEAARDQRNFRTNLTSTGGASSPSGATSTTRIDGFTVRGGINCSNSSPTIANNTMTETTTGIGCYGSSPVILNNVIAATGEGIYCSGGSAIIANNTIVGTGQYGHSAVSCSYSASPSITNNIIAFNFAGILNSGATPILRNNCVYGNSSYDYSGVLAGTGDISVDPLLVTVEYGNLHIQPSSPCLEAGDDTVVQAGWLDMDAQTRIQGSHVDIGADESNGTTWPTAPAVIRVSPSGNDANDGSSWALAKLTVQAGVDAAAALGGEVWVKEGTYIGSVQMRAFAHLFGGFAGVESLRSERDWTASVTAVSGGVICQDKGLWLCTLDGFTVRDSTQIGGMYCERGSPVIRNNIITANSVSADGGLGGGGILCGNSLALIDNNTITGNTVQLDYAYGGGICCRSSSPVISNNTIIDNSSFTNGGGIYCKDSTPVITDNTITGNCSPLGGGVYFDVGSAAFSNNIVAFNSSGIGSGGGTPVLRNNCVYGNASYDYSGILAGTGDISADPLLAGREYGNKAHIQPESPCVDAGWDDAQGILLADLDGQSRIQDGTIDIGVDESDGTAWPTGPNVIVRVRASGNDANDGSTWELAKRTVQAAASTASAQGGEVWVAAGAYFESVSLQAYAHLYGGFEGTETLRSERNWAANVTTLDGNGITRPIVIGTGHQVSRLDGFTIRNSLNYGVSTTSSGATISNNTVIENKSNGIHCGRGSAIITNNRIVRNGGNGIYCDHSSPVIADNVVLANNGTGGGIRCQYTSSPTITNNTIVGNSGGPAISSEASTPVVTSNIIAFNTSGVWRDAAAFGGTPVLRKNCVFGNASYDYSGVSAGSGDISVDPLLASREYGNVHIQPNSPCRNAGDDTAVLPGWVDIDGQLRTEGAHVDIGADESDGTVSVPGPYVVVRVRPDGNNTNNGSTWALATRTVQAGIDAAVSLGGDVWVSGTYTERVTIPAFTYLYGGFAGAEGLRSERDWGMNETVLDAGGASGSTAVTLPTGHRVSGIDGFTIRGAKSSGVKANNSGPIIVNNRITANSSLGYGGGIYCSSGYIAHNTITGNSTTSSSGGGGIYASGCATIANNIITGNSATASRGGGIVSVGYPVAIANNTIIGNTSASNGGGISCSGSTSITTIYNNVVVLNSSGIYRGSGTVTLRNNDVYGNTAYNYSGVTAGTGDISLDPLFVNQVGGDYHLTATSPCINVAWNDAAGLPGIDMDSEGRIGGVTVDMGADEYWLASARPSVAKALADGIERSLKGFVVTAAFDGFFYIEAADRNSGIRVDKLNHSVHAGDKVTVSGTLSTNSDGERFIQATAVVPSGIGLIEALLLPNRSIGGGDWLYNPVTGAGQRGQTDMAHLNNIGLRVSTTGKVTHTDSGFFYLDDGSSLDDGSGYIGVKVMTEGQPMPVFESYVKVTGASSCYKRDGEVFRLIRATAITPSP